VGAQQGHELGGALVGEEQLGAVELDDLGHARDRVAQPVRELDSKKTSPVPHTTSVGTVSCRSCGSTSAEGDVEAIRVLLVARRSARDVRIKYMNQIRHLGFTAPDELRERLRGVPRDQLARTAASLRPTAGSDTVVYATKLAIATLGRRVLALETDSVRLDQLLDTLVHRTAPSLCEVYGVGIHTAAILFVAAGDNPHRLRNEAAFAHLCGVAPLPASSGKITRHRLNPGGNRQANHALWRIVFTRMSSDERTRKYFARRIAEGRTTREIMRILKRCVAREIYPHLVRD
jgi:transposase